MEDRTLLSSFLVTNTGDSGPGSLRQAILDSNAQLDASTITFDPTAFATPQTITLTSGQLDLSNTHGTETITGPAAGVTVSGNHASRVFQVDEGVTASISGLTITGGHANNGGGLYNNGGTITLTECSVNGNSAVYNGGGLENSGTITLTNCTVSGNNSFHGAGLYNLSGIATLNSCTISNNYAAIITGFGNGCGGGLEAFAGTFALTDCTISGNSAGDFGGGLYATYSSGGTLTNCTISDNSAGLYGGGICIYSTATLENTIVAGNMAGTAGPDAYDYITSLGNNLIGQTDGSSGWVASDLTGTIATPLDPTLGPVGNYGGPTETMGLLPGSPAIDAGNNALIPSGVTTDQRGYPRIYHATVDIGAFELLPPPVSIAVSPSNPTLDEGVPAQFTAMGTFLDGETLDITSFVTWASSTPSVATISAIGVATAQALGTSAITASWQGVTSPDDLVTVTPLVSIAVSPGNPEVAKGVAGQFTATGTFADGSTLDITSFVTWASATPTVATISGTGLATALAQGRAVITASVAGVTSPADTLTVIAPSLVVNTTADDFGFSNGTTSLREAIAGANANPGQTITFDPTVFASAQTITLSLGQLELSDTSGTETITGPAAGVTVSGGGNSRVFQVDSGVTASISGLTITGGSANNGGGLANYGGYLHADGLHHRRQLRQRQRRRPVHRRWECQVDQLHRQRQLRQRQRRRPVRFWRGRGDPRQHHRGGELGGQGPRRFGRYHFPGPQPDRRD